MGKGSRVRLGLCPGLPGVFSVRSAWRRPRCRMPNMVKAPNGSGSVWKREDGLYGAKSNHDPATDRTKRKKESSTKPDRGAAHRWLPEKQTDSGGRASSRPLPLRETPAPNYPRVHRVSTATR